MTKQTFPTGPAGLVAGATLLVALAGCASQPPAYRTSSAGRPPAVVVYQDVYDYYPGYEVYYGRNRREYVYREGSHWVRRPAPPGIPLNVLAASPSVRVEFHDSPEYHHSQIVQAYPRNWAPPNQHWGYRERQAQGPAVSVNDYDYFPAYEIYYDRSHRQYVYFDGRTWVRQPTPRGVSPNVLFASPTVRLEFQDPPEQHHRSVARAYPRNWTPPAYRRDERDGRRDDPRYDGRYDGRRD